MKPSNAQIDHLVKDPNGLAVSQAGRFEHANEKPAPSEDMRVRDPEQADQVRSAAKCADFGDTQQLLVSAR